MKSYKCEKGIGKKEEANTIGKRIGGMGNMANVYLCIGTMKTGTSSLQTFMKKNEDALKKQGYCYPPNYITGRNILNRNAFFLVYKPYSENEPSSEEIWNKGMERIAELAAKFENIVLSDELIWHYSGRRENFWQRTKEAFEKIGCQVKVVVYLRRQDELVQSLWNQNVKSGERWNITFEEFIEKKKYRYFPLNYHKKLTQIAAVMGKENVIVRVYEREQFEGHDLIIDYTKTLGIKLNDDFQTLDETINPSLQGNFVEIRRMINGVPVYQEMPDFLRRSLIKASVEREDVAPMKKINLFNYEDQLAFLNRYAKSNEKVAREFLGREDGILFYKPIKEEKQYAPHNDKILGEFIHFSVNYMCQQQQKILELKQKISENQQQEVSFVKKAYRKLKKMVNK